jgi:membrane associated rhomboid family serine protease
LREKAKMWSASKPALISYILIGVNVAVFLYMAARSSSSPGGPVTQAHLDLAEAKCNIDDLRGISCTPLRNEMWRTVTSGFIHFGVIHIGFNMFALYQIGPALERMVGRFRFTTLYFAALLAGSAGVALSDKFSPSGGASGAIFGLFGVLAVALWRRGINPFSTSLGMVLILNLVITFTISNISIGAHIGGLIGGTSCGLMLFPSPTQRIPKWVSIAGPIAIAVISLVVAFAAGTVPV